MANFKLYLLLTVYLVSVQLLVNATDPDHHVESTGEQVAERKAELVEEAHHGASSELDAAKDEAEEAKEGIEEREKITDEEVEKEEAEKQVKRWEEKDPEMASDFRHEIEEERKAAEAEAAREAKAARAAEGSATESNQVDETEQDEDDEPVKKKSRFGLRRLFPCFGSCKARQ